MEMGKERQRGEQIQLEFHEHPLVFVDQEQISQSKTTYCSSCREVVLGPRFSCVECKYVLHQKCAETPPLLIYHPLHLEHPVGLFLWRNPLIARMGYCSLCMEKVNMFLYKCLRCPFSLHNKCALSSYNLCQNCPEFKHDVHQHPLTFIENHKDEFKRFYCSWCHEQLLDAVCVCRHCQFLLHKKCLDALPTKISHPSHRIHPLFLKFTRDDLFCKLCQKEHPGFFSCCSPCNFNISIQCAWPRPTIFPDKSHHEHPFTLFLIPLFICDACGSNGNYISYICSTCHIIVHEKCVASPPIIRTTRHHHYIIHNYFFQKRELETHDCGICLSQVPIECGSYNCLKQDCNFVAHVNCAMEMYVEIDPKNDQDEETSENSASNSSITHVIEENEHGEAMKIKHFSHEHYLTLDNKIKEDDDQHCDGCMLRISTSFYYCSQCEFLLHKTCAELPRKKYHWFHRFLTTLSSQDFFKCHQCDRLCSGFCYKIKFGLHFCLRCAGISHTLIYQGLNHSLFFDFKFKEQCSACGATCANGAFKCKDCTTFALDFACITLPQTTWHKCDTHFLKLAFHEESDDPKQYYCDICEEKRDPNHWFYHCAICDNSVHPKCVLGRYPFMKVKIGMEFPPEYRRHRPEYFWSHCLRFAKKNIFDSCSECGKPFQGVALECEYCRPNYIIHYDCWPPRNCRDG